jgi:hypothetical protein
VRLALSVLLRMLRTCVATVLRLMPKASAMPRLLLPMAKSRSTSTSRVLKLPGCVCVTCGCASEGPPLSGGVRLQGMHAQRPGRGQGVVEQRYRFLLIARLAAAHEHNGIGMLGVGQPRPGADVGVQRQGILEMPLRLHPLAPHRREQAEIAIGGAAAHDRPASDDCTPRIGQVDCPRSGHGAPPPVPARGLSPPPPPGSGRRPRG